MKRLFGVAVVLLLAVLVAGCGGRAEPTPTKTPRPTATFTPLPTAAAVLPIVESGAAGGAQLSPLATPAGAVSPLETPTATPSPRPTATPTPGFDARAPQPALAADLGCGDGCNAGNPKGIGTVIFNLASGQLNTWVASLDPLDGQEYEGWLVQGDQAKSTGRFNTATDGSAADFIMLLDLKDQPWSSFVLTIEPEPDANPAPAAAHSIGGPLRQTVMGEAIYTRFNMPCQQCHGSQAEGGSAPALKNTGKSFEEFLGVVRNHPGASYTEESAPTRDLQHIYAWLKSAPQ